MGLSEATKEGIAERFPALPPTEYQDQVSFAVARESLLDVLAGFKQGFGFADSLVQQNTANTANATLAMKELAKSVSTGGASDVASQSLKTVYTIGGVSVAVVLGLLLIKGGK